MRLCDRCGTKQAPYHPRTRVGDEMLCAACVKAGPGVKGGGVIAEASADPEEHPMSHQRLTEDPESTRAHWVSHHWDPATEDLVIPTHDWHGPAHANGQPGHTHRKETV